MRNAYLKALYELAQRDDNVLAIVADNGAIVYDDFRRDCPDQFINVGIAEANLISVAAGLAQCGKLPFTYTIAAFLTIRAAEQVRNDVCLQQTNVKLVGIGAGFLYSDLGPTHHATEDLAFMRALPGMTIICPADPHEAYLATFAAAHISGPVYIRLAGSRTPALHDQDYRFEIGRGVTLRAGDALTLISTGMITHEALRAARLLHQQGVNARLIHLPTVKPFDSDIILTAARETGVLLTVDEHSVTGGIGSAVAEVLAEHAETAVKFKRVGLTDCFAQSYGAYADMKRLNGLAAEHIVEHAAQLLDTKLQPVK